jgi:hypothetical protein
MRIAKVLLICLGCLIAVPAVWGQAANSQAKSGILGFLDPQTGAFRPAPQAVAAEGEEPALTTYTGTIDVTLTITVKSSGLTNFTCTATTFVMDNLTGGSPVTYTETNTVAATGSGSTRTCTLAIPYSWALATASSDAMSTSYTVQGTTGASGLPQRMASRDPLDSRRVPSSGATTHLSATVIL